MYQHLLHDTMRRAVKEGRLEVTYSDGDTRAYGPGAPGCGPQAPGTGPSAPGCGSGAPGEAPVAIALHDPDLPRRILVNADLAMGEAYMDGRMTIADDDLRGFMAIANRATSSAREVPALRFYQAVSRLRKRVAQAGGPRRARANVAHHYDLSPALYDLFLDADRQYSCAYFERPGMTLEEAQEAKKRHIARKLLIEPGMRVLDIGCGWGGLALTLAREHGARVVGVTLSEEQLAHARARAEAEGLAGRVEFHLQDYRAVPETFDRIVSVGMLEHVGAPNYATYFRTVRDRLAEDGVALIHTIGRVAPPGATSPWLSKWIFPGGYTPPLSELMRAVERLRIEPCDVEVWRLHYAETLRCWHDRFMARAEEAEALFDARFVRMWRWYLAGCEMSFRHGRQVVYQLQLARRKDVVPATRAYLHGAPAGAAAQAAE